MKIIYTDEITEKSVFNPDHNSWVYNGLDCCVTHEVFGVLDKQLEGEPQNVKDTYALSLTKQAMFLEISLRGFKIDLALRDEKLLEGEATLAHLEANFNKITQGAWGFKCNWRSPLQVKNLFYGVLGIKPVKSRNSKGVWAPSSNRDAMEKMTLHFHGQVFANHILAMRDLQKKLGFLRTEIDSDNRIRSSFNIAGTNTGRVASSEFDFGTGTNLQNVTKKLREPFVADNGMILVNVDLEQSDSRNLGAMIYQYAPLGEKFKFNDKTYIIDEEFTSAYLDACESGDLHTTVCRMAWPNLGWPEDRSEWRAVADQIFYRIFSYRDMAKRLGHGTNFVGTPRTMAHHTKTETSIIQLFQNNYFAAFPSIPWYHTWVREQLRDAGCLTTPYGRRRFFFGRWRDDKTLRDAVAYAPQSMTAHSIDMAMEALWRSNLPIQLLNQVHDSIVFQVPYREINDVLPEALEIMKYTIELRDGRPFSVPLEAQVGWNWNEAGKNSNYHGLMKWKGREERTPPLIKMLRGNSIKRLLK